MISTIKTIFVMNMKNDYRDIIYQMNTLPALVLLHEFNPNKKSTKKEVIIKILTLQRIASFFLVVRQ